MSELPLGSESRRSALASWRVISVGAVTVGGLVAAAAWADRRITFEHLIRQFEGSPLLFESNAARQHNELMIRLAAASLVEYQGLTLDQLKERVQARNYVGGMLNGLVKGNFIELIAGDAGDSQVFRPTVGFAGEVVVNHALYPRLMNYVDTYRPGFDVDQLKSLLPDPEVAIPDPLKPNGNS